MPATPGSPPSTTSPLITAESVDLALTAGEKEPAVRSLAERLAVQGRVTDLEGFLADVAAREEQMPTGLEGGIGIPHCRSVHVTVPSLAFGRSADGIDFGAPDGPADLVFLIAAPEGGDADHLQILSKLARRLMDERFTGALREADDAERTAALIRGDEPEPGTGTETGMETATESAAEVAVEAESEAGHATATSPSPPLRLVAVTACPAGIAHTYMAAEALTRAAEAAGYEINVETQGSGGSDPLKAGTIADADAVIFAADLEIRDRDRFAGKPVVVASVKQGVSKADDLVARAAAHAALASSGGAPPVVTGGSVPSGGGSGGSGHGAETSGSAGARANKLRQWLMTGVSYMIPFVAAGGLLIALGFAIGGYEISDAPSVAEHFSWVEKASWAALLFQIGGAAFGFLVPVLAGFIAYAMADRPGLAPGIVGGAIAVTVEAGFLGGLVAGLLAGAVVLAIQKVRIPTYLRSIMPVVVIPLLASMIVGFLVFVVVGGPIAWVQKGLTDWLNDLSGANAIILGLILGLMMAFDMGGPLNKVAYTFAVGGLANPEPGSLKVMAAVMAAGMVPPLGLALATAVRGRLFTPAERENGKAAWVLGGSFITEGAIPFAAADPLRVIPSGMAGAAVTGALSMGFGTTLRAPHGGVFVVPLIGSPLLYLLAVAAGSAVTALLVIVLKTFRTTPGRTAPVPTTSTSTSPSPASVSG